MGITDGDVEEVLDEMNSGTLIDVIPREVNGNIAIGLSVAIDSLRKGNYNRAIKSLEKTIEKIETEHIENDE